MFSLKTFRNSYTRISHLHSWKTGCLINSPWKSLRATTPGLMRPSITQSDWGCSTKHPVPQSDFCISGTSVTPLPQLTHTHASLQNLRVFQGMQSVRSFLKCTSNSSFLHLNIFLKGSGRFCFMKGIKQQTPRKYINPIIWRWYWQYILFRFQIWKYIKMWWTGTGMYTVLLLWRNL